MSCSKTIKILVLPGGGIRGIMQCKWLELFCQSAGIVPSELYNTFDIICGTSIGGITAMGYGYGLTPTYMLDFLKTEGPNIFTTAWLPGYQMRVVTGVSGYNDPDAPNPSDVNSGLYPPTMYARPPLLDAINAAIPAGTTLNQLNGRIIVTAWDVDESKQTFFSNISGMHFPNGDEIFVGSDQLVSTVALCTSAAPTYFPQMKYIDLGDGFGPHNYVDGGVFANNPVPIAVAAAKQLYPTFTRMCVLTVGNGLSKKPMVLSSYTALNTNNVDILLYLMEQAFIPGPQEFNNSVMLMAAGDPFNDYYSYTFNHTFTADQQPALDDASAANMAALEQYAVDGFIADQHSVEQFIAHLNAD